MWQRGFSSYVADGLSSGICWLLFSAKLETGREDGQQAFLFHSPIVLCTSGFYYVAQVGFELASLLPLPP